MITCFPSHYPIDYPIVPLQARDNWPEGVESVTAAHFEGSYNILRPAFNVRTSNIPKMIMERVFPKILGQSRHYCQPKITYAAKRENSMRDDSHVYIFSEGTYKLFEVQPGKPIHYHIDYLVVHANFSF